MNLTDAIRECAVDLLATEDKVSIEQVVACAERRYPEAFAEASDVLIRRAARNEAKKIVRDLSEDEEDPAQLTLPGIKLPSAIAIPDGEGAFYYVRTDKANWPQLMAGLQVREINVARAVAQLDVYADSCDALRPHMEHDSSISVADAARKLFGQ